MFMGLMGENLMNGGEGVNRMVNTWPYTWGGGCEEAVKESK